jgi:hypothetical protein
MVFPDNHQALGASKHLFGRQPLVTQRAGYRLFNQTLGAQQKGHIVMFVAQGTSFAIGTHKVPVADYPLPSEQTVLVGGRIIVLISPDRRAITGVDDLIASRCGNSIICRCSVGVIVLVPADRDTVSGIDDLITYWTGGPAGRYLVRCEGSIHVPNGS